MKKLMMIMAMAAVIGMAGAASAAITLIDSTTNNGSFELLGGVDNDGGSNHWDTGAGGDVDNWTNWIGVATATDNSGVFNSSGNSIGFMQPGNAAVNMTTYAAQEGDEFTFSFDNMRTYSITVQLVYDDAGTITALAGTDVTSTAIETAVGGPFTIGAGSPATGNAIGLGMVNNHESQWGNYDNFVLTVEPAGAPIPEPAGLGLVGLALLAVRKRRS